MTKIKTLPLSKCTQSNLVASAFIDGYLAVGLDLSKSALQVCYVDTIKGKIVNKQLTREQFVDFLGSFENLHIGIESCSACHYWAQHILNHGHRVTIIPSRYAAAASINDKDDKNDALRIREYIANGLSSHIRIKTVDELKILSLITFRECKIKLKVACENNLRAMLYELGGFYDKGTKYLKHGVTQLIDSIDANNDIVLSTSRSLYEMALSNLEQYEAEIKQLDMLISHLAKKYDASARFMTIPGVGALGALCLAVSMGDWQNFKSAKHFASYMGACPRHTGTGGSNVTLDLSKRGNKVFKRILFQGAMSLYGKRSKDRSDPWINNLIDRKKPSKVIVIAIYNKTCRIAWQLEKTKSYYDSSKN